MNTTFTIDDILQHFTYSKALMDKAEDIIKLAREHSVEGFWPSSISQTYATKFDVDTNNRVLLVYFEHTYYNDQHILRIPLVWFNLSEDDLIVQLTSLAAKQRLERDQKAKQLAAEKAERQHKQDEINRTLAAHNLTVTTTGKLMRVDENGDLKKILD